MDNELDLLQMRVIVRGALDCLNRDEADFNQALASQGKYKLITTVETIQTALYWMRRVIENALVEEEKEKV